jgi:hypothetical protein
MLVQPVKNVDLFEAACSNVLLEHGMRLVVGSDFHEYSALVHSSRPNHLVGMPFDPDLNDLNETNAFWIVGLNDAGDVVHSQALRMLDLENATLGMYLLRNFRSFPPPGVDIDFDRSRYRAGPGAMRMSGRVAYHGEFWLHDQPGEYRGRGLSTVLSRQGFCRAMTRWDPDHIVAFMASRVAHKGLAARAGWMHTEPSALRWYIKEQDMPIEGFLGYVHREDIHYLLDISVAEELPDAA